VEIKSFFYELKDGKQYEFCERLREDVSLYYVQALLRKDRVEQVYQLIKEEVLRDGIILKLFEAIFNDVEVWQYILGHIEEVEKLVYQSFKTKNKEINPEQFKKLVDESLVRKLFKMLINLEKDDEGLTDEQVCSELKINKNKLIEIKKAQPHVYDFLKHNVMVKKKKEG
jgi:hypothetical protein